MEMFYFPRAQGLLALKEPPCLPRHFVGMHWQGFLDHSPRPAGCIQTETLFGAEKLSVALHRTAP